MAAGTAALTAVSQSRISGLLLTAKPTPAEPNAPHSSSAKTVAATPPDAAYADGAISIADATNARSGAVAVISAAYTDCCDAISVSATQASVVAVVVSIVVSVVGSVVCRSSVCIVGGRGIPVIRRGGSGIAVICRGITVVAATVCLGHACRQ
jgi:hypothetical protein